MIPSDHFVRFYNEVFKFLDERDGLQPYYEEISRHQELHCLEQFRSKGLQGVYEYYQKIRVEENCVLDMKLEKDRMVSTMERCPSLSKVLDCDAEPCVKYCEHCAGWSMPLSTKCGIYYVQNMVDPLIPRCVSVRTEDREVALRAKQEFLDSGVPPEMIRTNLDRWEEVEKNKPKGRKQ